MPERILVPLDRTLRTEGVVDPLADPACGEGATVVRDRRDDGR